MRYQESLFPWAVYFYPKGSIFGAKLLRRFRTQSAALGFKQVTSQFVNGEVVIMFDLPEFLPPVNVR